MSDTQKFIETIAELARYEYFNRDKWILPSVCIAQSALESGWNLNATTLFGIKGSGVTSATQEFLNGKWVTITDTFEAYPDIASSVHGYYDFLANTPRYVNALNEPSYKKAVNGLIYTTDGLPYATAPNYIQVICDLIEQYDLTRYDSREDTEIICGHNPPIHFFDGKETLFAPIYYGEYTCSADSLNVRNDAGTDAEIMTTIQNGCPVLCCGFYRLVDDIAWILIQFYQGDDVFCGWAASGSTEQGYFERIA